MRFFRPTYKLDRTFAHVTPSLHPDYCARGPNRLWLAIALPDVIDPKSRSSSVIASVLYFSCKLSTHSKNYSYDYKNWSTQITENILPNEYI